MAITGNISLLPLSFLSHHKPAIFWRHEGKRGGFFFLAHDVTAPDGCSRRNPVPTSWGGATAEVGRLGKGEIENRAWFIGKRRRAVTGEGTAR